MKKYQDLFKAISIGGVKLKNRIVMPPMETCYASLDGSLNRKSVAYYLERAKGGCGLIIVEAATIDWPYSKVSERQFKINDFCVTSEWHDLADAVQSLGTKIIIQIFHGGFISIPEYCEGAENISASDTRYEGSQWPPARAMTIEEIRVMVQKFILAARVAKNAGLNGVEVHAAHSSLLNQFLSPATNKRTDEYGGNLDNRARIVKEIIEGIRLSCPGPFIISVRLPTQDCMPGGITIEEGVQIARILEDAGADLINASVGFATTVAQEVESQWDPEGNRLFLAKAVKEQIKTAKVAAAGKLRSPQMCNDAIARGETDLVCIGRQLICDPQWPNKVLRGMEENIRPCLNCHDGCLGQFFQHGNVHCTMNPYVGYEDLWTESDVSSVAQAKNIIIAGGGVAGLQAAIIARKRGHQVTVLEKSDRLGGQLIIASVPPHKNDLARAREWFVKEAEHLGVKVQNNTTATLELIQSMKPDCVIVATGSVPSVPPITGIGDAVPSWNILDGSYVISGNETIVIIGGGTVGCETAHYLHQWGCNITIIECLNELCFGQEAVHKGLLSEYMRQNTIVELAASVKKISKDAVLYTDRDGQEKTIACDLVIYATGQSPVGKELFDQLNEAGIEAYQIGDSQAVGNIRSATLAALGIAYLL